MSAAIFNGANKALKIDQVQMHKEQPNNIGALNGKKVTIVILAASTILAAAAAIVAAVFAMYFVTAACATAALLLTLSAILSSRIRPSKELLKLIENMTRKIESLFVKNQILAKENHDLQNVNFQEGEEVLENSKKEGELLQQIKEIQQKAEETEKALKEKEISQQTLQEELNKKQLEIEELEKQKVQSPEVTAVMQNKETELLSQINNIKQQAEDSSKALKEKETAQANLQEELNKKQLEIEELKKIQREAFIKKSPVKDKRYEELLRRFNEKEDQLKLINLRKKEEEKEALLKGHKETGVKLQGTTQQLLDAQKEVKTLSDDLIRKKEEIERLKNEVELEKQKCILAVNNYDILKNSIQNQQNDANRSNQLADEKNKNLTLALAEKEKALIAKQRELATSNDNYAKLQIQHAVVLADLEKMKEIEAKQANPKNAAPNDGAKVIQLEAQLKQEKKNQFTLVKALARNLEKLKGELTIPAEQEKLANYIETLGVKKKEKVPKPVSTKK